MRIATLYLILLACGCAVFTGPPAHFAGFAEPPEVPVPKRLQPGDRVWVYNIPAGTNDTSTEVVLDDEGRLDLPRVGRVCVLGMTYSEAEDALARVFIAKKILPLVPPHGRSRYYQVTGEVQSPGRHQYLVKLSLSQAIESAGGPTKSANLRRVSVQRASGVIERFDLLRERRSDPEVLPGDTVEVVKKRFLW